MKIVKETKTTQLVNKNGTKVGELYAVHDGNSVHLRCQGGFANIESGGFTQYEDIRTDNCWVHLPNAELHLNN